ncbi:MAG: DUF3999 family protein [Bryobacteraceae bacterium]
MKRVFLIGCLVLALLPKVRAQAPGALEPLSAWPYFKELRLFRTENTLRDFVLDGEVLNQARPDQADLRLYDGAGREIPYVLRVRHDVDTQSDFAVREFNRSVAGGAAEVSCDLGVQSVEHNLVEIDTAGSNFRRLADVQGSADGSAWSTLASQAILFRFSAVGRSVEQSGVPYPVSRYRYLRVRVSRDPQVDSEAPQIAALRVRRSVRVQGEMVAFPAERQERDADRMDGRPASVWRIDLGVHVPFERLSFDVRAPTFSRQFQLEIVDDPAAPVLIASGELTRETDTADRSVVIAFAERVGRRLILTVVDDRNPPLPLVGITAIGAARQVIFEAAPASAGLVRLYYGNPKALAPRYDLGMRIPANAGTPLRMALSPQNANPVYRPEPKPFSERSPWLIYLVLGAASLTLAAVLLSLARAAKAQPQV